MNLSYEYFIDSFLKKISEYNFLKMPEGDATDEIISYMKTSIVKFYECDIDILSKANDAEMVFEDVDIDSDKDASEIADIVSDIMVVMWLKPYLNNQENLENILNTDDYKQYSPANLLKEVNAAHNDAEKRAIQCRRDYSFNHNDLTGLHI